MSELWNAALARYRSPRQLKNRGHATFEVRTVEDVLIVRPSDGAERRIAEAEFVVAVPLLDRPNRTELLNMTFNSTYIRAIRDDLRGS